MISNEPFLCSVRTPSASGHGRIGRDEVLLLGYPVCEHLQENWIRVKFQKKRGQKESRRFYVGNVLDKNTRR